MPPIISGKNPESLLKLVLSHKKHDPLRAFPYKNNVMVACDSCGIVIEIDVEFFKENDGLAEGFAAIIWRKTHRTLTKGGENESPG